MLSRDQAFIQSQQVDRVGPLTVGVAHDLNNLLAIIAGNLETLSPSSAGVDYVLQF
jgi:hypothetical protein